jgi:hypothetical protein
VQAEAAIDLFLRYAKSGDAASGVRLLAEVHRRGTDSAAGPDGEYGKEPGQYSGPGPGKCDALISEANLIGLPTT